MAKSRSRGASSGRATPPARQAKATSRRQAAAPARAAKAAPVVAEDAVEKGLGTWDGVAILTGVMLLMAWLLTDYVRATRFDGGMFF